jgi:3-oxoacyl-[acyl-carrier protein] reductase
MTSECGGPAVELGPEAITVNCICPGPIRTAMTAVVQEKDKEIFAKRRVALRRYAEPEEVAHAQTMPLRSTRTVWG